MPDGTAVCCLWSVGGERAVDGDRDVPDPAEVAEHIWSTRERLPDAPAPVRLGSSPVLEPGTLPDGWAGVGGSEHCVCAHAGRLPSLGQINVKSRRRVSRGERRQGLVGIVWPSLGVQSLCRGWGVDD